MRNTESGSRYLPVPLALHAMPSARLAVHQAVKGFTGLIFNKQIPFETIWNPRSDTFGDPTRAAIKHDDHAYGTGRGLVDRQPDLSHNVGERLPGH